MWIGWLEFDLLLGDVRSLKQKRSAIRPVIAELQRRFAVSAAETGAQDLHRRAHIGLAVVAADRGHVVDVLDAAERLVAAIKAVLEDAIAAGGSSLRDHRRTDGELGSFQHKFRVYDRAGGRCPTRGCPGTVRRIAQNGRSTFFCPVCQK